MDGHEEMTLALLGPHLCDIDVEEADGVDLERLLAGLVSADLGQAADPVAHEQPVQRRPGQVRDGGL